MHDFLAMGGYGLYVWASYGLAAVILTVNALAAWHRHGAVRRQLRMLLEESETTENP